MMQLCKTSDVGISCHVIPHSNAALPPPPTHPPPVCKATSLHLLIALSRATRYARRRACCLACTALGGVSAVELLERENSAQRLQSSPSVTNLPAKLSLSRRSVASLQSEGRLAVAMTSTAEADSWPRAPPPPPLALVALRCHYRRATLVSPQDCPRVPRAAGRRRCTPSNMHRCARRKRAVDWPRCQGLSRSTPIALQQMRCLAPAL